MIKPVYLADQSQGVCFSGMGGERPVFLSQSKTVFPNIEVLGKVFLFFLIFFLLPVSVKIYGQTPPSTESSMPSNPDKPVAFMPFLGDDLSISGLFQDEASGELTGLGGYSIRKVSAEEFPQTLSLSPDYPPEGAYLGGVRYAVTGEYYVDMDDLQHFQLWLWNSINGSLIYTDEMVFEDMEEANSYLPPMISWVFSHIPVEERITIAEVATTDETTAHTDSGSDGTEGDQNGSDRKHIFMGKLNLGLRGGGSYNSYGAHISAGGYEAGQSQGFSGEGAVILEFRIFRLLGLQAEAVFTHDTFKVVKVTRQSPAEDLRSTDQYKAMSLMFPFLVKVPIEIDAFTISPFGGGYFVMPIGEMTQVSTDSGQGGASYGYEVDPPFGLILGVEAGFRLGPGEIFADLRFGRDIGMTMIRQGIQYSRTRLGLSLGYKFKLWERR
jgi:hypothetical protein